MSVVSAILSLGSSISRFSSSESSKPPPSLRSSIHASDASFIGRPKEDFFSPMIWSVVSVILSLGSFISRLSSSELSKPPTSLRSSIHASDASFIGRPKENLFSALILSVVSMMLSLGSLIFIFSSSESSKPPPQPTSSIHASDDSVIGKSILEFLGTLITSDESSSCFADSFDSS